MAGLVPTRSTNRYLNNYTWLADYNGLATAMSGTLNAESFRGAGTHKVENWITSGVPLGRITTPGPTFEEFGLYDPDATNGLEKHFGFLKDGIQFVDNVSGVENQPLTGAILTEGQIIVARLPVVFDLTKAGVNKTGRFLYRT